MGIFQRPCSASLGDTPKKLKKGERRVAASQETRLIDKLGWARSAGSLEDTMRATRRKLVAACDHSMPRRRHGRTSDSMYWWNDQLTVVRRKCLTARRRFTRSKGDPLLRETWKKSKSALRQGIKKSRLECWKDLIGEVEKDRSSQVHCAELVSTRRAVSKTGPEFLRGSARRTLHSRGSKESRGGLRQIQRRGSTGCQTRSSKRWPGHTRRSSWKPLTPVFGRGSSSLTGRSRGWSCWGRATNL